jgi:hypothetical protein
MQNKILNFVQLLPEIVFFEFGANIGNMFGGVKIQMNMTGKKWGSTDQLAFEQQPGLYVKQKKHV